AGEVGEAGGRGGMGGGGVWTGGKVAPGKPERGAVRDAEVVRIARAERFPRLEDQTTAGRVVRAAPERVVRPAGNAVALVRGERVGDEEPVARLIRRAERHRVLARVPDPVVVVVKEERCAAAEDAGRGRVVRNRQEDVE